MLEENVFYLLYSLTKYLNGFYYYSFKSNNFVVFSIKSKQQLNRGDIVKIINLDLENNEIEIEKSEEKKSNLFLIIMLSRAKFHKDFSKLTCKTKKQSNILKLSFFTDTIRDYKKIFCLVLDSNDYNNFYIRIDNQFNYELSFLKIKE